MDQNENLVINQKIKNNAKFQYAKQKINEFFIDFVFEEQTQKLFENALKSLKDNGFITKKYPESKQKIYPLMKTGISKVQPPVKSNPKLKFYKPPAQTIIGRRRIRNEVEDQPQSPRMSLQPGCMTRTMQPKKLPNLEMIIYTNQFGEEFNKKEENLNILFEDSNILTDKQFDDFVIGILNIPIFFKVYFTTQQKQKPKKKFFDFWKENFSQKSSQEICWFLLTKLQTKKDYLTRDDFKLLIKEIVEEHQDYDIIKEDEHFKLKFRETILEVIFFVLDHDQDGKILRREFLQSDFINNIENLQTYNEEDSKKFNFFSYDYFYIICCLFNELDEDQDGFISSKDLENYQEHCLSSLVIKRIFQQVSYKFTNKNDNNLMNYKDFIWFLLCEEDKTSYQSIQYWFNIIDLNSDSKISQYKKII